MKKIAKYLCFGLTIMLCNMFITNVYAATKINVTTSAKQVIVGKTFKAYITISSSENLGSWQFDLNYDTSKLSFVSSNLEGNTFSKGVVSNSETKEKKYTVTFKVKASGTSTIGVKNVGIFSYNEKNLSVTSNKASVKALTQAEIDSSKSSVNTLSSLGIQGQKISPKFDKNTTSYNLTVENKVTSVKVTGTATDSKAGVSGLGTKKLSEGANKINIVVTAENGSKKTYTINVTRKELNPINITINNEEYTVVRNKNKLDKPDNYSDTTVTIEGESVPALENETTGYKLVGLINPKGETNLYVHNEDTYTLYNEHKFGGITLYIKEVPSEDSLDGTKEETIKLGEEEITAYKIDNLDYPLIYGMNIETGKTNWYTYDSEEESLQRFISGKDNSTPVIKYKENKVTKEADERYIYLSIILGSISVILLIGLVVSIIKLNKRQEA